MWQPFQSSWRIVSLVLLIALLASMFLFPTYSGALSITLLILSIGSAVVFTVHRHWQVYRQGESTREKILRNIFFDLLGLAPTTRALKGVWGRLCMLADMQAVILTCGGKG